MMGSNVIFDSSLKARWDYENSIAFTEEKARRKEVITIARELKREGLSINFIAKTTKLSAEEIEKL